MRKIKIIGEKILTHFVDKARNANHLRNIPSEYNCKFEVNWLKLDPAPLPFKKNWEQNSLPEESGAAFLFHDKSYITLVAVMQDSDVFSNAKPINDTTWLKGDTLEFFIQPLNKKEYYEFHVAPNLATLQLKFNSIDDFRNQSQKFEDLICDLEAEFGAGLIAFESFHGWWGLISVPKNKIQINSDIGAVAKFAICRYNYTKNKPTPECSSTAPLSKKSFHAPEEWQTLILT